MENWFIWGSGGSELLGFMVIDTKTAHIVEKRVLLGALMGCGVAWLHGHCEQDCAHCGET